MSKQRAVQLWVVNVVTFIVLCFVTLTGLVNWLILPRGYRGGADALWSLRHFVRDVHQWTALLFIACVVVHLFMHWDYIKTNLHKHGLWK